MEEKEGALMEGVDHEGMEYRDEKVTKLEGSKRAFLESEEIGGDSTNCLLMENLLLNKAMEELPIGLTISDLEGRIIYTNPAEAAMHGYIVQELIGKDVRIFAPRGLWQPTKPELNNRKNWRRETVNMRKDKSIFPVLLTSKVIKDQTGSPIGFVTLCEDLTSHKQTGDLSRKSGLFKILGERSNNNI